MNIIRTIKWPFSRKARVEQAMEDLFKATPWMTYSYFSYSFPELTMASLRLWINNKEFLDIAFNTEYELHTTKWTENQKAILVEMGITEQDLRDFRKKYLNLSRKYKARKSMGLFRYDPKTKEGSFY